MKTIRGPFRKQVASDVIRDGLGVELLSGDEVVAEVFRCDADHTLTITTFDNDLPLAVVEEFIATARQRLGGIRRRHAITVKIVHPAFSLVNFQFPPFPLLSFCVSLQPS